MDAETRGASSDSSPPPSCLPQAAGLKVGAGTDPTAAAGLVILVRVYPPAGRQTVAPQKVLLAASAATTRGPLRGSSC